jgi:hypothetical protein
MAMSFEIFGIDIFRIQWYHVFYTLIALLVTVGGTQQLYSMGVGRAVIFAIGAVLTFYFFDQRWFGSQLAIPSTWPPTVNMCPDYLTFIPKINGSKSVSGGGCVDLLGVTSKDAGLVPTKKSELLTITPNDTNRLFEYTSDDVKAAKKVDDLQKICSRCNITGLTWEGVFDGDTCNGIAAMQARANKDSKCNADFEKGLERVSNSYYR